MCVRVCVYVCNIYVCTCVCMRSNDDHSSLQQHTHTHTQSIQYTTVMYMYVQKSEIGICTLYIYMYMYVHLHVYTVNILCGILKGHTCTHTRPSDACATGEVSPTTDFLSLPKAQMQSMLLGTWNLVKLHRELKYFGNIPRAFATLQTHTCIYNVHTHVRGDMGITLMHA